MIIFKLPDLGEGLPDAIIREWYVKTGDEVAVDQPLVAMETAKALVDVPAPYAGKIAKLYGEVGDTIDTGNPLIGFEGEGQQEQTTDAGTVVGAIETSDSVLEEAATGINSTKVSTQTRSRATPKVRALARQLGVDLANLKVSAERISAEDVRRAAAATPASTPSIADGMEPLSPARKAMIVSMESARDEAMQVTIFDDVNIDHWGKTDITVRVIKAIAAACQAQPVVNATFDRASMSYHYNDQVNLGIAIDTEHGLFVPVIKDIGNLSDAEIRAEIDRLKAQAESKSIAPEDLQGATLMLSNFGSIAARYANPVVVPPMVCIVGVGKIRDDIVPIDGEAVIHRILPLVVTTDHRFVTGGEAVRFLGAMMGALK